MKKKRGNEYSIQKRYELKSENEPERIQNEKRREEKIEKTPNLKTHKMLFDF